MREYFLFYLPLSLNNKKLSKTSSLKIMKNCIKVLIVYFSRSSTYNYYHLYFSRNNHILNQFMFNQSTPIVLFIFVLAASAFQIKTDQASIPIQGQLQAIPWPFTTCGDGDWTIESLTMDQTPKRNTNNNIVATGTANKPTTFKKADVLVKLNGAFLDKQTAEFVNSYDEGDIIQFVFANYVPSFAPIGNYNIQFQFIDSKDKNNGCLQLQFKL